MISMHVFVRGIIYLVIMLVLFFNISYASVEIVEVMCNPVGRDSDFEWIKIKNTSTSTVDISGFFIRDSGVDKKINYAQQLASNESAYIARNKDKLNFKEKIFQADISLNNTSDKLALLDKNKNVLDEVSYSKQSAFKEGQLCYSKYKNTSQTNSASSKKSNEINVDDYDVVFNTITIKPAPDIFIKNNTPSITTQGSKTNFSFYFYNSSGDVIYPEYVNVNTGDGKVYNKFNFTHVYMHSGNYLVSLYVKGYGISKKYSFNIDVTEPDLEILSNKEKIVIKNNSDNIANISGFTIYLDGKKFRFPNYSFIPEKSSISLDIFSMFGIIPNFADKIVIKNARNKIVAISYIQKDIDKKDNANNHNTEKGNKNTNLYDTDSFNDKDKFYEIKKDKIIRSKTIKTRNNIEKQKAEKIKKQKTQKLKNINKENLENKENENKTLLQDKMIFIIPAVVATLVTSLYALLF